jgi:ferritin-like metal-binding protein YciE
MGGRVRTGRRGVPCDLCYNGFSKTAAQRVEHYEIASYGTVATYAELLSDEQPQELLQATLDEEKRAAQKLTELPKAINVDAAETIGDEPEDTSLI